jgi:hypothetical protein
MITNIYRQRLIATLLVLGGMVLFSANVLSAESAKEISPPVAQDSLAPVKLPPAARDAVLAKFETAQKKLDAARARLEESGAGAEAFAQLDLAQYVLDQSRVRLLGVSGSGPQVMTRERVLRSLDSSQAGLDQARKRLAGKAGARAELARIDASQKQLDRARQQLEFYDMALGPKRPSSSQMQAMYDIARQKLDEARAEINSVSEPDPVALEKLKEAERRLEAARRRSVALGLLN